MAELVYLEARANVLNMGYGERGWYPAGDRDVLECLARGLVVDLDRPPPPAPPAKNPCGCGS